MNTTDNTTENPYNEGKVLLIDKPYGVTSFAVVKRIRYYTKARKVGHAGTLDPLATGLLILCTGKMTRSISGFQAMEKEYTGTMVLGATTPSFDMETPVDKEYPVDHITEDMLRNIARQLTGEIEQVPPVYSAVKVDGKRAYELARKDAEAEIKAKTITIYEFELTRIALPEVDFRVVCSKGTYIRSLARDFGTAAGSGAYLSKLVRTRIGEFRLENALTPEAFTGEPMLPKILTAAER